MNAGIVPLIVVFVSMSSSSLLNPVSEVGMVPVIRGQFMTIKDSRFVILPKVDGIEPVRRDSFKNIRSSILCRRPSSVGIVPCHWFGDNINDVKPTSCPTAVGIVPVRKFEFI